MRRLAMVRAVSYLHRTAGRLEAGGVRLGPEYMEPGELSRVRRAALGDILPFEGEMGLWAGVEGTEFDLANSAA